MTLCPASISAYTEEVPKLWSETIEAHRHEVREAIMDAAWALVTERGLSSTTMSQVAERSDIGRATLYKYFPDVESILLAWHERHVAHHLAQLTEIRDRYESPDEALRAVLEVYATIAYRRGLHGAELVALLHRGEQIDRVQHQLRDLVRDLIADAAAAGEIRRDVAPEELAGYCLHALSAAGNLSSEAAVARLVAVTLDGLRAAAPDASPAR